MLNTDGSIRDPYMNFIAVSRYARFNDEIGRRETWSETVDRYVDFMLGHLTDNHDYEPDYPLVEEIRQAIKNLDVVPSMRSMMTAGPALERSNIAGYNCAALPCDDLAAFSEALYILLNGTGVGFSVERRHVNKLSAVPENLDWHPDKLIVVGDSKEGWATAYKEFIESIWLDGEVPHFDLASIRPAGARLVTFGGRASGPEPLRDLFNFTAKLLSGAQGRRLRPIEVHDLMCKIASVVVVGGVRRAAMISLSDLDDQEMAEAKSGEWWVEHPYRALANNSAVYEGEISLEVFNREWANLVSSGSGERGIFNRTAAQAQASRNGLRDERVIYQVNPCSEIILRPNQFCVTGDTPLITADGIHRIEDLRDKQASVWNGEKWSQVTVRRTRENAELVRVTFSDGSYLDCTPDHRFSVKHRFQNSWHEVEAKDLMSYSDKYAIQVEPTTIQSNGGRVVEDAYTLGFAYGDGHIESNKHVVVTLYGEKKIACPVEGERGARYRPSGYKEDAQRVRTRISLDAFKELRSGGLRAIAEWDRDSALAFLAGLADSDGSVTESGGIRIYVSGENNVRDLQLVLTKFGIRSSANLLAREGTTTNYGPRSRDLWYLQIGDARELPCTRLDVSGGHSYRMKGKYQTVRSVVPLDYRADVYCFNEPERHMAVFANVLTYQCNLSEVIVREDDTYETLARKVEIATILGTWQSTLTEFPFLRDVWRKNTEEERLLGVSLTGVFGNRLMYGEGKEEILAKLNTAAWRANAWEADEIGINPSVAICTQKPSGTVSQLAGVSSGGHPWHAKHYIRTVRADNKDPLAQLMKDSGVPNEPDVMNPDATLVFSFPIAAPDFAVTRADLTAIEHLEHWLAYKRHWCDHTPSVTISVRESEWEEVGDWVYGHLDDITGISFLPYSEHTYKQAPYQEISAAEYRAAKLSFPDVRWADLPWYELEDSTTGSSTLACSASGCDSADLVNV